MHLTDEDYMIAGFCEAMANNLSPEIVWHSFMMADTARDFDDYIQVAVRAGEWLDRVTRTE